MIVIYADKNIYIYTNMYVRRKRYKIVITHYTYSIGVEAHEIAYSFGMLTLYNL
jgi:hypothetical protein